MKRHTNTFSFPIIFRGCTGSSNLSIHDFGHRYNSDVISTELHVCLYPRTHLLRISRNFDHKDLFDNIIDHHKGDKLSSVPTTIRFSDAYLPDPVSMCSNQSCNTLAKSQLQYNQISLLTREKSFTCCEWCMPRWTGNDNPHMIKKMSTYLW